MADFPGALPESFSLYGENFTWQLCGASVREGNSAISLVQSFESFISAEVEWLDLGGERRPAFGVANGRYLYSWKNVGEFLLDADGGCIRIFPSPSIEPSSLQFVFLRGVLPRLLHLRGIPCLHAGAVEHNGLIIAFLGLSGDGKSTVAAGLTTRGFCFVTDDVLPLRRSASGAAVLAGPGLPEIRLTQRGAVTAGVGEGFVATTNAGAKGVWTPGPERTLGDAAPLAQVYVLRPFSRRSSNSQLCRSGRLFTPVDALLQLAHQSHWFHPKIVAPLASDLGVFGHVAATVPVQELLYELSPRGLDAISQLIEAERTT